MSGSLCYPMDNLDGSSARRLCSMHKWSRSPSDPSTWVIYWLNNCCLTQLSIQHCQVRPLGPGTSPLTSRNSPEFQERVSPRTARWNIYLRAGVKPGTKQKNHILYHCATSKSMYQTVLQNSTNDPGSFELVSFKHPPLFPPRTSLRY